MTKSRQQRKPPNNNYDVHTSTPQDRSATITTVVRIVAGAFFIIASIGKFTKHAHEVEEFERFGVPIPEVSVYVAGIVELLGGLALVLGKATRIAALLLAANMVGAIATAGRVDGGPFHLGVAPALLLAMVYLLWTQRNQTQT